MSYAYLILTGALLMSIGSAWEIERPNWCAKTIAFAGLACIIGSWYA